MSKKKTSTDSKLNKESANVPSPKSPEKIEEKSSKELLFENLNKFLPTGYSSKYDDVAKIEETIVGLQEQIDQIEELIKPIKRIERKRGIKSSITPSERKLLKITKEKLKTQLIIERNNWEIASKSHRDSTKNEIQRTKDEQLAEQGRSGYYVKKNKNTVINRIKVFFDDVLQKDTNALGRFKKNLAISKGDAALTIIQEFVREQQGNPFLVAFFQSHKKLQELYILFIKELMREWNGRKAASYKFTESQLTLKEE